MDLPSIRASRPAFAAAALIAVGFALEDPTPEEPPPAFEQFEWADLVAERQATGDAYLPFLERSTLSTGLYELPAGGRDGQQPHSRDEVYAVKAGRARFTAGEETTSVGPGSVLFVKARVPHRFHDIEEDLQVLVFFSSAPSE